MEASAVPRPAPAGVAVFSSRGFLRFASDVHLVALVREGRPAAFEAVYDRHHRPILSFCRHMLGDQDEAQDAVQHTFMAAYNELIGSDKPIHLRAWLFTIARNRCYSLLRARREQPSSEIEDVATEGLATQVQHRQDLRDLVRDMRLLPYEQRAAIVLAELDSLSHKEIGDVLGVPTDKVKALVFQARESLVASRAARETDCTVIREQLSTLRGGGLRRANLRRHLRECSGCREFRKQVERQRRQFAIMLPVAPTVALKEGVLAATFGGGSGAVAAGGGLLASSLLKGGLLKLLVGAAIAGVGTAGTFVVTHTLGLINSSPRPLVAAHRLALRPDLSSSAAHQARWSVGRLERRYADAARLGSRQRNGHVAAGFTSRYPASTATPSSGSHRQPVLRRSFPRHAPSSHVPSLSSSTHGSTYVASLPSSQGAAGGRSLVPRSAPRPGATGQGNGHHKQLVPGSSSNTTGSGSSGSGGAHHGGSGPTLIGGSGSSSGSGTGSDSGTGSGSGPDSGSGAGPGTLIGNGSGSGSGSGGNSGSGLIGP